MTLSTTAWEDGERVVTINSAEYDEIQDIIHQVIKTIEGLGYGQHQVISAFKQVVTELEQ